MRTKRTSNVLGGSLTLANLENDHGFISKESKAMRYYAKSGQYHIIVESRDS